jgi:hypothetical protein
MKPFPTAKDWIPDQRSSGTDCLVYRSAVVLLVLTLVFVCPCHGQNVPIVSGSVGMTSVTNEGVTSFSDIVNPVFALPLGSRVMIEGRYNFDEFFIQDNRTGPYKGSFLKANQITQLDYIINSRMTLVFGQSLVPFNTYNERLSQLWQQNFVAAPLVAAVGTRDSGTAVGAQLRGNAYSNSHVQLNYIGWFSKRQDRFSLNGSRAAGDRIDVVFPNKRIEIGTSFARYLEFTRYNSIGAHFYWLPWRSPLQVRAEYAHDPGSQGYWMEVSYRLSQIGKANGFFSHIEPLFRMQQTFRNHPFANDGLPNVDTKIADFGMDYHFPHDVRLNSSYSRKFAQGKDGNIWALSLNYRFLFPAWPEKKR